MRLLRIPTNRGWVRLFAAKCAAKCDRRWPQTETFVAWAVEYSAYALGVRSNRTTSPAVACLPSFDFSKTGRPSRLTSKRPPPDGINSTRASGNASRISAAKLVARGS